jgi:hypothetical protein
MSTSLRLVSAFFTGLPGFLFLFLFLVSDSFGRDYWWEAYTAVLIVLSLTSLLLGFALPTLFRKLRMPHPWLWIFIQGLLAWGMSLVILGLLNLTPLCVGQNNGDGNNDLGMCMFMTALSGIVYTPFYLGLLAVCAMFGHWILSPKLKVLEQ